MEWLKAWLREWLEVPPPVTPPPAAKKLSGALYAEIRSARAEVEALRQFVQRAEGESRLYVSVSQAAKANGHNLLTEVRMLHEKLDAVMAAMGYTVVADGENTKIVENQPLTARSQRLMRALLVARDMDAIVMRCRGTVKTIDEQLEQARRLRAEFDHPTPY